MKEKINKFISVYKRDGFKETFKKVVKHINYNVFFKHNPRYLIDFYMHKKKYSQILDKILKSKYKYLIVWRGSFGWKVPLFQRPQHIARELSNNECLVLYATYKDDKVISINKIKNNLYLINFQNKRFVKMLEQKISDLNKPKFIQIYSTDWFKTKSDLKKFISQGYKILYEYIDDLAPELTGTKELSKNIIDKYNFCLKHPDDVLVVASADKLYDDVYKIRKDKNVVFSSNGVEYEHFKNITDDVPENLKPVVDLKKPIIGYYGALAKWFDYDLIRYICKTRPDYKIVLIGLKYDTAYDLSEIDKLDNVYYLGVVDYKDLPNYVKYFDVATIPFLINDITKSTSPCKLFEYMSSGKPIVTTDLNECRKYKSVLIGKNKKDFVKKLDEALKLKNDKEYLKLLDKEALENTWNKKAKLIVEGIDKMENK